MNYTYTDELYHHGIKGQKWGIRRFQNEDGSLTPAGRDRYGIANKLKNKIEEYDRNTINEMSKSYQERYEHISKEEADEVARKNLEFARKAAIAAAAVTLTAAGVYAYRQYGRNFVDETIKSGTTIQTLSMDQNRLENGKAFYTAYTENDKQKYVGLFGKEQQGMIGLGPGKGKNKYAITANVEKDIKVASNKSAEKAYKELQKNDPEFRKLTEQFGVLKKSIPGEKRSEYELFNTYGLLGNDKESASMQSKFFSKLKEAGYQGVNDVNDRKYSGFNTRATIVFDNDNFKKNSAGKIDKQVRELTNEEIQDGHNFAVGRVLLDEMTKPVSVAKTSIAVAAGATYVKYMNSDDDLDRKNEKRKQETE